MNIEHVADVLGQEVETLSKAKKRHPKLDKLAVALQSQIGVLGEQLEKVDKKNKNDKLMRKYSGIFAAAAKTISEYRKK